VCETIVPSFIKLIYILICGLEDPQSPRRISDNWNM